MNVKRPKQHPLLLINLYKSCRVWVGSFILNCIMFFSIGGWNKYKCTHFVLYVYIVIFYVCMVRIYIEILLNRLQYEKFYQFDWLRGCSRAKQINETKFCRTKKLSQKWHKNWKKWRDIRKIFLSFYSLGGIRTRVADKLRPRHIHSIITPSTGFKFVHG